MSREAVELVPLTADTVRWEVVPAWRDHDVGLGTLVLVRASPEHVLAQPSQRL